MLFHYILFTSKTPAKRKESADTDLQGFLIIFVSLQKPPQNEKSRPTLICKVLSDPEKGVRYLVHAARGAPVREGGVLSAPRAGPEQGVRYLVHAARGASVREGRVLSAHTRRGSKLQKFKHF